MDMPTEPKSLRLARALHDLLHASGATRREQLTALQIVEMLLRFEPASPAELGAPSPQAGATESAPA